MSATNSVLDMFDQAGGDLQKTVNETSSEASSGSKPIKYPGKLRVKVRDTVIKLKTPDKNNREKKYFPEFTVASTGTVMHNLILTTTKAVPGIPEGSDVFFSYPVLPSAAADADKKKGVIRYMKPIVCALLDVTEVVVSGAFMAENLTNDYDDKDVVTRHHKMTGEYFIDLIIDEDDPLTKKGGWNLKVNRIEGYNNQELSSDVRDPENVTEGAKSEAPANATTADISPEDSIRPPVASNNIEDDLPF